MSRRATGGSRNSHEWHPIQGVPQADCDPGGLAEEDMAEYLADLFHEDATPGHDSVRRLP